MAGIGDFAKAFLDIYFNLIKNFIKAFLSLFFETFSQTLTEDSTDWQGYCLVQRIEPVRLSSSGKRVRLTLRGASTTSGPATIDRISISRPAASGELYASAADLTNVPLPTQTGGGPYVLPANASQVTPPVDYYNLDKGQPLL